MKKKILESNLLFTLLSIVIGFVIGAVLLLLIGINPGTAYAKLFTGVFSQFKYVLWSIVYASPLIFTGLSVAFSFQTGVFNIGAEGQFVVGSLAACVVGIFFDLPAILHVPLCLVAAAAAGVIWSAVVGYLKVKRGINEVLSYIMFNWIAFYLSNYVVNIPAVHKEGGGEATKDILASAKMSAPAFLTDICSSINFGFLLAVLCAFLVSFVIRRTTLGFQLRAVGHSRTAAEYAGISSNRIFLISMSISGALAGLGGAVQILGMSGRISQFAGQEGYGFQGITVALIAGSNPVGCILSGLFYGMMKYGGNKLTTVGVPNEVVNIIMGTIIFFIAISHVFRRLLMRPQKGGSSS